MYSTQQEVEEVARWLRALAVFFSYEDENCSFKTCEELCEAYLNMVDDVFYVFLHLI